MVRLLTALVVLSLLSAPSAFADPKTKATTTTTQTLHIGSQSKGAGAGKVAIDSFRINQHGGAIHPTAPALTNNMKRH